MLEKLLIIYCYFDYHPKTKLVDVLDLDHQARLKMLSVEFVIKFTFVAKKASI